ncbi:hypothetical protein [Aureimonas populi]|uniref:Uncharacterized protein n=1 Tax=Aureimonas populi TaxID=1701758 RepID=A0ABW5CK25_9HYPH|nr:hypothetical protein [Aureimonas populi]
MQKRRTASVAIRWALLAACLLMAAALIRLFWWDASDGREARETDRMQGAQEPAQGIGAPPPAPAQE